VCVKHDLSVDSRESYVQGIWSMRVHMDAKRRSLLGLGERERNEARIEKVVLHAYEMELTLFVDVLSLYVIGIQNPFGLYWFQGVQKKYLGCAPDYLATGTELSCGENYNELGYNGVNENGFLIPDPPSIVGNLLAHRRGRPDYVLHSSLVGVCFIVSESIRFHPVMSRMESSVESATQTDIQYLHERVTTWQAGTNDKDIAVSYLELPRPTPPPLPGGGGGRRHARG